MSYSLKFVGFLFTPYSLRDKTQSILTQVVSHLDYSAMIKQRQIGPDVMEDQTDSNAAFLDALRTRAMDELVEASTEYGILLKDLAVIDRQFKGKVFSIHDSTSLVNVILLTGDIASTMDKLTTRALQAQVEAAVRWARYSDALVIRILMSSSECRPGK